MRLYRPQGTGPFPIMVELHGGAWCRSDRLADKVIHCHDAYWKTEAAMDEGCPARALEQGERAQLPPVLYLQGTEDLAHPRPQLDRFVAAYRKAGGVVDLELFDGEGQGFIMRKAGSPASNRAIDMIIEFVHKQIR